MTIGERIRELRKQQHMDQKDLAAKSDLSVTAIQNIEHGDSSPRVGTLQKIANALNVSMFELDPDATDRLFKQSSHIAEIINQQTAFINYLNQLGYTITGQDGNRWIITTKSNEEIFLNDDEMGILRETTEENIDLRINYYLHDGKHTKK